MSNTTDLSKLFKTGTREAPEPTITMKLAPQAKPVSTGINPVLDRYAGINEATSALETANSLKNFMGTVDVVNKVALDAASQTAEQEYLQNKSDWGAFSEKHPLMSHLNPHIQDSFAKLKADEEAQAISGELATKIRPDMTPEEYQAVMKDTKQKMYQSYTSNGVTMYDLEKSAIPKLDMLEQQSNAQYYAQHAKYQYEVVKKGWQKELQTAIKNKDIVQAQAIIDKASIDLNSIDGIDIINNAYTNHATDMVKVHGFNPQTIDDSIKQLKWKGKTLDNYDPDIYTKSGELVTGFRTAQLQYMKQQHDLEQFEKDQKVEDLTGKYYKVITESMLKGGKDFSSIYKQAAKEAGTLGIYSEMRDVMDRLTSYGDTLSGKVIDSTVTDDKTYFTTLEKTMNGEGSIDSILKIHNISAKDKRTLIESLLSAKHTLSNTATGDNKAIAQTMISYEVAGFTDEVKSLIPESANPVEKAKYDTLNNQIIGAWKAQLPGLIAQANATGSTDGIVKAKARLLEQLKSNSLLKDKPTTDNPFKSTKWVSPAPYARKTYGSDAHLKREGKGNEAVDMVGRFGDPVVVPVAATLKGFIPDGRSGFYALLDTKQGVTVTLSHLDANKIAMYKHLVGKKLKPGDVIGAMGTTGYTQGMKPGQGITHIVVRENGMRVPPEKYMQL